MLMFTDLFREIHHFDPFPFRQFPPMSITDLTVPEVLHGCLCRTELQRDSERSSIIDSSTSFRQSLHRFAVVTSAGWSASPPSAIFTETRLTHKNRFFEITSGLITSDSFWMSMCPTLPSISDLSGRRRCVASITPSSF
jgi:hypothetical protein